MPDLHAALDLKLQTLGLFKRQQPFIVLVKRPSPKILKFTCVGKPLHDSIPCQFCTRRESFLDEKKPTNKTDFSVNRWVFVQKSE
jgi:hypothetical protein